MILQGNSYRIPLKDESVHCCVSSFPYYGLRSYGLPPTLWGGDSSCRHIWATHQHAPQPHGDNGLTNSGLQGGKTTQGKTRMGEIESAFCQLCSAWLGQFGLEPSISLHVQNAVLVCREIKRVLRKDGIFWLNYGDSYATGKNGRSAADTKAVGKDDRTFRDKPFSVTELPAKNLCGIPWRVALALQDDGWILRSEIPWIKKNSMPSSVTDRPGTAHEHVFMLVKSSRYYYDSFAVRRPAARIDTQTIGGAKARNGTIEPTDPRYRNGSEQWGRTITTGENGRALRTSDPFFDSLDAYIAHLQDIRDNGGMLVDSEGIPAALVVNSAPYKFSHYATFPPKLIAPLVKVTPEKVCPNCGAPWVRVVEKESFDRSTDRLYGGTLGHNPSGKVPGSNTRGMPDLKPKTTGWRPTCKCNLPESECVGGIICDPFAGSGTVGAVATEHGRRFIGIDLSATYLAENALVRSEKKTSQKSLSQLPMFAEAA